MELRETAALEKETELNAKADHVKELEAKVEEIPTLIAAATEEGIKKGKADADKSNAFEVRALKKDAEYQKQLLERLNPYLPRTAYYCGLSNATGDSLQADVETKDLYTETAEKFDIYHINVNHRGGYDQEQIKKSFLEYLDDKHFCTINKLDDITDTIVEIITSANESNNIPEVTPLVQAETDESGAIVW